jgi:rRNA maturation protein Nop10
MRVKTNIKEQKNINLIEYYWKGNCPACNEQVKIFAPPTFSDWESAYKELEARYEILKKYTVEYSSFLEKQVGYYPEDKFLQEALSELMERLTKFAPYINFDKYKGNNDTK